MGASSSSAQDSGLEGVPTLDGLTDDLHFVLDESTGDLRVRFASSSSGAAATASGGGARASGGGGREVGGEGQGEGVVGREEEGGDGAVGEGEREEEEEEVDVDSEESDDDDDETTQSQLSTLRLLARLFGGSRTSVPQSSKAMARNKVYPPAVPMSPSCDLYHELKKYSADSVSGAGVRGQGRGGAGRNMCNKLAARQLCLDGMSRDKEIALTQHMMPQHPCLVDVYTSRAFCGTYNRDGSIFICAVQDNRIFIYDTSGQKFEEYRTVLGRDVGWSILDMVFSPDQYWFAYSTWSPCVNVCNVYGGCFDEEKHYSLDMRPDTYDHFCAFSVRFSNDSNELITAASDGYLYIYNRDICDRTLKIDAHQDDADAVAFADESSQIIFSAGDDGLCKVWDRRALSESHPYPVGCLAGHRDGITFIDTKGDGRYLITNSKDQTIKLWDIRKFSSKEAVDATLCQVQQQTWDYRWQNVPKKARREAQVRLPGDSSVMTYTGHMVKHTLLRARFSPAATTGQRYIYTACAKGRVIVFDVLTGEVVQTLMTDQYKNCVRDVSWHPTQPAQLVSTSWDGILQLWTHNKRPDFVPDQRRRYFDLW